MIIHNFIPFNFKPSDVFCRTFSNFLHFKPGSSQLGFRVILLSATFSSSRLVFVSRMCFVCCLSCLMLLRPYHLSLCIRRLCLLGISSVRSVPTRSALLIGIIPQTFMLQPSAWSALSLKFKCLISDCLLIWLYFINSWVLTLTWLN